MMSNPANSKQTAPDPYIVRRFVASDAESFFDAVRDSIDALAYWLPWCKPDYSIRLSLTGLWMWVRLERQKARDRRQAMAAATASPHAADLGGI